MRKSNNLSNNLSLAGSALLVAFGAAVIGAELSSPMWATDPAGATQTLEKAGYKPTEVGGYTWFTCGKGDLYHTGFKAINQSGQEISGTVCKGLLKSSTIRFD